MGSNQKDSNASENEGKLLDHNYDGIQELDNPLPSWWVSLFYGSIVFAFIYLVLFSFFIPSEGVRADEAVKKLMEPEKVVAVATESTTPTASVDASSTAAVDPGFPNDEDTLAAGKKVFMSKCLACHGAQGEGLVGPNMTDDYWIHGKGTELDIYNVVVNGVPEKGMISWKPMMSDEEIRAVVVYLKTLQGTNPPNPKAPQGEKVG